MRSHFRSIVIIVGPVLMLLPGCGGSKMAQVTGRVTFKGEPVGDAYVTFTLIPKDDKDMEPGKPATGKTEPDGTFRLSTYKVFDGVLVGSHRVMVYLDDTNPCKCNRNKIVTFDVPPRGGELNIEMDP